MKCPIPLEEWPDWVNWAAMDESGFWYFYQTKPKTDNDISYWYKTRKFLYVCNYKDSYFHWRETLTHRSELKNQKQ